jgi:exodeoxyribonuclease VII large subunit
VTVSQLTQQIKRVLGDHFRGTVHVIGEVSNYKAHGSGHRYFTLKDAQSEVQCVMWRSDAAHLQFDPRNGLELIASGQIAVFERAGRYQLYVRRLQPCGTGALELALRQLSEKLRREGLFDPAHKKLVPRYPGHVAVVTSPTGAAVRDILRTLHRRYPAARVSLVPVAVQGPDAASTIAEALALLSTYGHDPAVDTIILGRGGGSIEDLWAFNEEIVARAIHACPIPIISGVGHEVDVTISDLVADLRAATPTAAAEHAVPDRLDVLKYVEQLQHRLSRRVLDTLRSLSQHVDALAQREPLRAPRQVVRHREQQVDVTALKLVQSIRALCRHHGDRLTHCDALLARIEPASAMIAGHQCVAGIQHRLDRVMMDSLKPRAAQLDRADRRLLAAGPRQHLPVRFQQLDVLAEQLERATKQSAANRQLTMEHLSTRLQAVGYRATLQRGYSVTQRARDGRIVRDSDEVRRGDRIRTETAAGAFESIVDESAPQLELFE